jgi:ATP-dependent Clp protease ATP-binding subunit ClpC
MSKFDPSAHAALSFAQSLAANHNHAFVNTEHLLFALVTGKDASVRDLLQAQPLKSFPQFCQSLERLARQPGSYPQAPIIRLDEEATKAIGFAAEEARTGVVETHHLLLGIVRVEQCRAAILLALHGLSDIASLRASVTNLNSRIQNQEDNETPKRLHPNSKLAQLGAIDLTQLARLGKLDPIFGRDAEILRLIKILGRRQKNNAALIGDPGVGKTAIAEGLAQRIATNDVPQHLLNKIIVSLNVGNMVAGTTCRGQFEDRMKELLAEIRGAGNIIIFIDEMHTIVGAGSVDGSLDAANLMKAALARGELQCFGATTLNEYRKYFEKDAAMARRFQPIFIGAPSEADTITILEGLRPKYELHHKVFITDSAISAAVKLSDRYLTQRFQPDKAIDLMDEACAEAKVRAQSLSPEGMELLRKVNELKHELQVAAHNDDNKLASAVQQELRSAEEKLNKFRVMMAATQSSMRATPSVTAADVEHVVSSWTGIPTERLTGSEAIRLLDLAAEIHKIVIGQNHAVDAVSAAVRRARAGLSDPKRPAGSFLFLGPTGVGKTELARALAKILFGSVDAMVRLDMSEYMEKFNVSKLLGAPPGYIGYDQPAALTEPVRRRPYSLILLDEIEKAHPDVWNILLQILDNGRITDAQGRIVDFRNTIIVMTSNVGARSFAKRNIGIGFSANKTEQVQVKKDSEAKSLALEAATKVFPPEFLNRIDEISVFSPLTPGQIRSIVDLRLAELNGKIAERGLKLVFSTTCKATLAERGYDPTYGARPLQRVIMRLIETPLSEEILRNRFHSGDLIKVSLKDGQITFEKSEEGLQAA